MLTPNDFPLNAMVSFDLHPAAVMGTGYKGAKVLAILDAATAFHFIDPVAQHANVYPFLPEGTPNRYDAYPYLKLKLADGSTTAIGIPWVKDETLEIATTRRMRLTIDAVTPEAQNLIIKALSANGFSAVDVELLD